MVTASILDESAPFSGGAHRQFHYSKPASESQRLLIDFLIMTNDDRMISPRYRSGGQVPKALLIEVGYVDQDANEDG